MFNPLRLIGKCIQGTKILDRAPVEEQVAVLELWVMGLVIDGMVQMQEEQHLLRFARLVDWKFTLLERLGEIKNQCCAYLDNEGTLESFIEVRMKNISNQALKIYLCEKYQSYFIDGQDVIMEQYRRYHIEYLSLLRDMC